MARKRKEGSSRRSGKGRGSWEERLPHVPALTQARIMTELQADPEQVEHVKEILETDDPAAEIAKEQEKVAMNVISPELFPEVAGRWPVFRQKFQAAWKNVVRREAREKKHGIVDGMGSLGQWEFLVKEAMGIVKDYGVPALKKNISIYQAKKSGHKEADVAEGALKLTDQAEKALDKELGTAKEEQAEVSHEAAPLTNPEPEKKKAMPTTAKVGIAAGAGVLVLAVALIAFMGKKK